jgi:ABC-2 type transport system permease protein
VLFTSLGIGFAISIVSQTDSQAVQYSMMILLGSVFFSGFIMSLDMLLPSVRIISWRLMRRLITSSQ